jgi:hypothetical protein
VVERRDALPTNPFALLDGQRGKCHHEMPMGYRVELEGTRCSDTLPLNRSVLRKS